MNGLRHQCWIEIGDSWYLVGEEKDSDLSEAQGIRDYLRSRGVNAEVRSKA